MTTEENMIPIEPYLKDFKQYLDANSRCILSAKFGDGKSYFISSFIKEYSDEYLFIPIYPVNYQVMDNKDIFELIKRDILIRLLSNKDININEIELSNASLIYSYFMNKSEDAILDVIDLIPKINVYGVDISISSVIKKIKNIKDKFDKYKEQFKSVDKTSELYITKFDSLKGSIYEFDSISQLIHDIICEYRKLNPTKKVVLIIEDLDRIDPAHIFRILNVFSAHFDRYGVDKTCGDNKFCLDKIVTVCDINNIKKIYAHVYGDNTDFTGYISKFSNSKEYIYSLKDKLKWYITNILLDKDLEKYPQISDILSDIIISSMDDGKTVESNLRIIKERTVKANYLIRIQNIKLNQRFAGKYITSSSDFTKLLALLKAFGFSFTDVDIEPAFDEFVKIIGKYWTLAPMFDKKIIFEVQKNKIEVAYYREIARGIGDFQRYTSIYNCFDGDQIIDFDISGWDAEALASSLIFGQINNIVDYLNRKIII